MSWDYEEYTKPCPCEKVLIQVCKGYNDWGQTSYNETILCPECKEKDELEKVAKVERKRVANQKIKILLEYFVDNYLNSLVSKFENKKTKKEIWRLAYDLRMETYSESYFSRNNKLKDFKIESYIKKNISWRNIRKLADFLSLNDSKFEELYLDAKNNNKEFDDEDSRLAYLWAKGRI